MKKAVVILLSVLMLFTACSGKITEEDKALVRGSVADGVYTNDFADFKFNPGEGWTFASDDEILAMMDLTASEMNEDDKAEYELGKLKTIYDAMAVSDTGANIIVMYENLALTIGGTSYDEAAYAEVLTSGLDESTGYTYTVGENKETTINGQKYLVGTATAVASGINVEQSYLLRKIDNYMLCICVTTYPELTETYDEIIAMFS